MPLPRKGVAAGKPVPEAYLLKAGSAQAKADPEIATRFKHPEPASAGRGIDAEKRTMTDDR
jgi:hypothetical protein